MSSTISKYDRYPRDYTVVGVSAAFHPMVDYPTKRLYGRTFQDFIFVVRDGRFFHFQRQGDREKQSRAFLRRYDRGFINARAISHHLKGLLTEYQALLDLPSRKYTLQTLLDFYRLYMEIVPIFLAGVDSADFIDELPAAKRPVVLRWLTNIRISSESVYKFGESFFIPRYLRWLAIHSARGYAPKLLSHVFFREMQKFLQGRGRLPSLVELRRREKLTFIRLFPYGRHQLLTGAAARREIQKRGLFAKKQTTEKTVDHFRGQTAFPGKAMGRVRIVRTHREIPTFRAGEILVASMTDPVYLPIMRQALAFITNEGGTLSHAAIVARELKKPCVTGTRIATHVLHNGDLVRVDAEQGIVTVVQKA